MVVVATALGPHRELQQTVLVVLWRENSGGFLFVFGFVWGEGCLCFCYTESWCVAKASPRPLRLTLIFLSTSQWTGIRSTRWDQRMLLKEEDIGFQGLQGTLAWEPGIKAWDRKTFPQHLFTNKRPNHKPYTE